MTRLFFGSLPFPSALTRTNSQQTPENNERQGVLRAVDCDHYRAVPISDGAHVLFTDPVTGLLCLGSDAPLGGPTKLMRKVCMIPPASAAPEGASALMCYRAGHDLRWGIRTVAAYDDGRIVLYNLHADCFERIRYLRSSPDVWDELAGVLGQSDLLMDVFMGSEQTSEGPNPSAKEAECGEGNSRRSSDASGTSRSFRSLQVNGLEIWRADCKVEDIQIDCASGGIKVWLFMTNGRAVKLDIYVPRNFKPTERYVGADGLVHDTESHERLGSCSGDLRGKRRAVHVEDVIDEGETDRHVKFVVYD